MAKNSIKKIEPIILFGDTHLRAECKKVEVFHKGLREKVDIIANTLENHGGGAALAAPQISLLKQIIVINYLDKYYELVNPEILDASGKTMDYEGCLSLPGFTGRLERFQKMKVRYQDRTGEFHVAEIDERMARCFQHEMDHLKGILFIDRMKEEFVFNDYTKEKVSVEHLLKLTEDRYDG
jgi:peptide deformylase